MTVRKPLNVNDEELVDGMDDVEQPLSRPTAMSYSLQRLRLAEISRHLVDRTPLIDAHAGGPSLDVIMDIDTELQMHINETPSFFSMSKADLIETYQLDSFQATKIVHMGSMHRSLFYAQRCNLHLPFFSRGYVDPAFSSSKESCLRSARLIIQTEIELEQSGFRAAIRYKFLGLVTGVFLATTVVLMDLCHNKSLLQEERQRSEVVEAFRILEQARHESETAAKFLDSMMHVLRKHKISPLKPNKEKLPNPQNSNGSPWTTTGDIASRNFPTTQQSREPVMTPAPMASPSVPEFNPPSVPEFNETNSSNPSDDLFAGREEFPSYFDDFAQSFGQGIEVGTFDWNNIFSELDASLI